MRSSCLGQSVIGILCVCALLLSVIVPFVAAEEAAPSYAWGDIDGTTGVSAADALLALQIATKKVTADAEQTTFADVDGSGDVAAADALMILQYATKKISEFPAAQPQRTSGNPIFTDIFTADPSAHVWTEAGDERLYVYASHDQFPAQGCDLMDKYHIYSTSNMVDWYDHGEVLSSDDVPWDRPEGGFMWAPDATYKDGKYYYFFPHPSETAWNDSWKIGVAVSDKPAEDFELVTERNGEAYTWVEGIPYDSVGHGLIDPCVFKDDDGKYYMSVGGAGKCYIAEMTDDLLAIKEDTWTDVTEQLRYPGEDRTGVNDERDFHEGSWIFKRGDLYYLMYPDGSDLDGKGANQMRYAIADNVMGPYVAQAEPLLDAVTDCETTHGSIVEYKGHWYLFYHNAALSGAGNLRSVCVDEVFFNEDGTIQKVIQTTEGVKAIGPAETGKYAPNQTGALIIDNSTIAGYKETYTHAYDYTLNYAFVDVDMSKVPEDKRNPDGTPKETPRIEGAGSSMHTVMLTAAGAYLQFDGIVGGKADGKALLEVHYSSGDKPNFQVRSSGMEGGGINATTSYYMRMETTGDWGDYSGVAYCLIDLKAGADNSIWLATGSGGANFTNIRVYLPEENVDPTLVPKDPTLVDFSVYTGPVTAYDFTKNATVGTTSDDVANTPKIEAAGTVHNLERAGAYVEVSGIDGGRGGLAMVTLTYASANGGTIRVSCDGKQHEKAGAVGFEATAGWDDYTGQMVGLVELKAGTDNVIRFTGGSGGVNLKNFTVTLLPQE